MKGFYGTIYEQNSVNLTDFIPLMLVPQESAEKREEGGLASIKENPPTPFRKGGNTNLSFLQKIRKGLQKNIVEAYGENPQA